MKTLKFFKTKKIIDCTKPELEKEIKDNKFNIYFQLAFSAILAISSLFIVTNSAMELPIQNSLLALVVSGIALFFTNIAIMQTNIWAIKTELRIRNIMEKNNLVAD